MLNPELQSFGFHLISKINCFPESRTNGAGVIRVATALSESSSIHSDALYHLTREMSGMGLEPMSFSIPETEPHKDEPWAEESQRLLQVIKGPQRVCAYLKNNNI